MAKESRVVNISLLVVSTFLGALGQLFYKYAFGSSSLVLWIGIGLLMYALSTVIYLAVLSRSHLSWAYGLNGLSYIFATIFAAAILFENVPLLRWIGVGVIFIGVVLIGLS